MVCLTVCLSYCVIVCLFYAKSAAKILLFLHICKQNPKNMQNLPISALFCFILRYCVFPLFVERQYKPDDTIVRSSLSLSFSLSLPFLPFPLCTFRASLREPIVPIGALLCPLRRDLIPTKTPPKSPFLPENLIILTFPSPKICTYQKNVLSLHPISGQPLTH